MKKKKKFIVLAGIMTLSIAGCSKSTNSNLPIEKSVNKATDATDPSGEDKVVNPQQKEEVTQGAEQEQKEEVTQGTEQEQKAEKETGNSEAPQFDYDSLGVTEYVYPDKFSLENSPNLKATIELMAVADAINSIHEDWFYDWYIDSFFNNSCYSFDYLNRIVKEHNKQVSKTQIEYVLYSLCNEYVPYTGMKDSDYYTALQQASGYTFGSIELDTCQVEEKEDEVQLTSDFTKFYMGKDDKDAYVLKAVLVKNPYSCFDGYSIKSIELTEKN